MGNPFKQDFIEARMNAKLSPEKVQAMMDAKSRIYTAKFIHAGVCGYRQQNDITYLSRDVLYRMADSYLGRPVIVVVTLLNAKAATILNVLNAYKEKLEQ